MSKVTLKNCFKICILLYFLFFLGLPIFKVFTTAFVHQTLDSTASILDKEWKTAFYNSITISLTASGIAVCLGFLFAYGIRFTNIPKFFKRLSVNICKIPMLLPTITYGFVLIYAFGTQGIWTKFWHPAWFSIYGKTGIIIGFVIYTLPPIFLLIDNGMRYLDTQLFVVSRLMHDKWYRSLYRTVLQPLQRIIAVAFLQGFFMAFTDFGIPAALSGKVQLITTLLYEGFMGTIPDFQKGAMIAVTMLFPSIISIILLNQLQKNVPHFDRPRIFPIKSNKIRDSLFVGYFSIVNGILIAVFSSIIVIPFIENWPYDLRFTFDKFNLFFQDSSLWETLRHSLILAVLTAVFGTFCAYFSAILTAREEKKTLLMKIIDSISIVTNSIPGMVLGIAYLLVFRESNLKNGLLILVLVTIIHYFSTPYQMAKEALQKMNLNWENSARLMGDSWIETVYRILIPNSKTTILEMFAYYFVNSMVTISAVVFLTSAQTMLVTTKLKELQHFGRFNEIFILSFLLLIINLSMQIIVSLLKRSVSNEKEKHLVSALFNRIFDLTGSLQQKQRRSS